MFTFGFPSPKFPCRPGKGKDSCPMPAFEDPVAEKPCACPIICEDVPGRQDEVCDSFDAVANAVGYEDGFDLWEAFFTSPGSREADEYEIEIE